MASMENEMEDEHTCTHNFSFVLNFSYFKM